MVQSSPGSNRLSVNARDGFLKKAWRVHDFAAWFQRELRQSNEFREKVWKLYSSGKAWTSLCAKERPTFSKTGVIDFIWRPCPCLTNGWRIQIFTNCPKICENSRRLADKTDGRQDFEKAILHSYSNSKSGVGPACQTLNANITNERMARMFQKWLAKFAKFAYFASKKHLPKNYTAMGFTNTAKTWPKMCLCGF